MKGGGEGEKEGMKNNREMGREKRDTEEGGR